MSESSTNLYNLKPLSSFALKDRQNIQITPNTKWSDNDWDFGSFETNPNVKASSSILRFGFELRNGESMMDPRYDSTREDYKELTYAIASSIQVKAPSPPTLKKKNNGLRYLSNWMNEKKISSFSQLSIEDTDEYILHLKSQDLHSMTKVGFLDVLKSVWEHRKQLSRPIKFDPLRGKSSETVLDIKEEDHRGSRYDFIPDSICQDLIRYSVKQIQDIGPDLAVALLMRDEANLNEIKRGSSKSSKDRAKRKALENTNYDNYQVTELARQLLTCCYIVIIFFTGLRASEMLTLGPGQIEQDGETTWIFGRLIKIKKKAKKWMAPKIVFKAFSLAQTLTQPMRDSIDYELSQITDKTVRRELEALRSQLFIGWSSKREHGYNFIYGPQVSNVKGSIHTSLKEIVELANLKDEDDDLWNLHPHQFRKSFVRFMCARVMNIRYLQEHMGHTSLDMTAWYDTDDLELTQEIEGYLKELKSQKLQPIFEASHNITGAGAESFLNERRDHYVGIVSIEKRNAFVQNLSEDVSLKSTGHSWCMSDSTNGNCTGVVGCMMDITMTQKCPSALITEEHLPEWQRKKEQYELLIQSSEIGIHEKNARKIVLQQTINPIIIALSKSNGEENGLQ